MSEAAELMNRLAAALEGGDIDTLVACWHPDAEAVHVLRPDRSWQGRDFYRKVMGRTNTTGERNRVEVKDRGLGVTGDRFYLETLVHQDDGIPVPCVAIYIMKDGLVRWARVFTDKPKRDGQTMADWALKDAEAGTQEG
jgi:ketosteroid isomerase-like protein